MSSGNAGTPSGTFQRRIHGFDAPRRRTAIAAMTHSPSDQQRVIRIVTTACHPEDEDKFNRWYDEVHVPHVLAQPGAISATRCKVMNPEGDVPEYITIYEFASEAAFRDYEKARSSPQWKAELVRAWGRDPHAAPGPGQRGFHAKAFLNSKLIGRWGS